MAMRNVDPAEIARFQSAASRWWDPQGEMRPLHDLNPGAARLRRARRGRWRASTCSTSVAAADCSPRPWHARARGSWDSTSPATCSRSRELHALEAGVRARTTCSSRPRNTPPRHAAAYDVVTCMEMLEHVPDPAAVVDALARMVRPGGHVFLSTINRTPRAYAARDRRRRIRAAPVAAGNAHVREVHPAVGAVAAGRRPPGSRSRTSAASTTTRSRAAPP